MNKLEDDNVKIFKVICNICRREIVNEMLYYKHPKHGFVCEACPQFGDGGMDVMDPEG